MLGFGNPNASGCVNVPPPSVLHDAKDGGCGQINPIHGFVNSECLCELARSAAQVAYFVCSQPYSVEHIFTAMKISSLDAERLIF